MIKPVNQIQSPQLSAIKPRTGLNRLSDLLPRLVEYYERQAQLMNGNRDESVAVVTTGGSKAEQTTFGWD